MKKQNIDEAKRLIEAMVSQYKDLSYIQLLSWVEDRKIETMEVTGDSGTEYQVELEALWDDKPKGNIRFLGSIYDDSHSRVLKIKTPVTHNFIKRKEEHLSSDPV